MMDNDKTQEPNNLSETLLISQKVIPYLHNLGYKYLDNEFPVAIRSSKGRADLIAFTDKDKTNPYIVVEVKKKLPHAVTLFDPPVQNAFTLAVALGDSARYLLITDGYSYYWYERSAEGSTLVQISNPPEIIQDPNRSLLEKTLIPITDPEQFLRVMQSAIQALKREGVLSGLRIGIELNRILIAKLYDEQVVLDGGRSNFRVDQEPPALVAQKIEELYNAALSNLDGVSSKEGIWFLSPNALAAVVTIFEPYALSSVTPSILEYFFWQALSSFSGLNEGHYTTPLPLAELLVHLVQPQQGEHIIDPACGTGLFLIESLKTIGMQSIINLPSHSKPASHDFRQNVIGIERNAEVAELAITNFVLNGIPSTQLIKANALDKQEIVSAGIKMGTYDIVLLDPPIGTTFEDERILRHYEIAQQSSRITSEMLFIELAVELARPGGVIAIIVPDSLLSLPSYLHVRTWLLKKTTPKAIISLPPETFAPVGHSGKASILLLRKTTLNMQVGDNVLVADVQSVGYDKFGQITGESGISDLIEIAKNFLETGQVKILDQNRKLKVWSVPLEDLNNKRLDVTQLIPENRDLLDLLENSRYPLTQLNKLVEIIGGQNFKKYVDKDSNTAIVLQAGSVRDLDLDLSAAPYISSEDYDSAKRVQVRQSDILVTTTGQYLGRATVITELPNRAVISGAVTILRPTSEIDPLFLAAVISSNIGKEQIAQRAITMAQPYIRRSDLGTVLIPIPSLVKQKLIATQLRDKLAQSQELFQQARELELTAKNLVIAELLEEGENA